MGEGLFKGKGFSLSNESLPSLSLIKEMALSPRIALIMMYLPSNPFF